MLPLCLHMQDFASYREPTTVDFHGADYFALVGPTGAGKSTVIDAICFALYGTVPRWGRENVVSLALPPSATTGRVALVFEAGARRYGAVRVLARNRRGVVSTKEARLDELDRAVPPGSTMTEMLGAVVRPVAEGNGVTAAVEELIGLRYRHFTQCVILPQGRFAELLHAPARDRQDLLVELLGAGLYRRVQQRAAREAELARATASLASAELASLADVTEDAERAARRQVRRLRALRTEIESSIASLSRAEKRHQNAADRLDRARRHLDALGMLAMPSAVRTLGRTLRSAELAAKRAATELAAGERAGEKAERRLERLGDRSAVREALAAYAERERLTADLATFERDLRAARRALTARAKVFATAGATLREAEELRDQLRDAHQAAGLAGRLRAGHPCPVCLQTVVAVPEHTVAADLDEVALAVRACEAELDRERRAHRRAEDTVLRLTESRSALRGQVAALPDTPDADTLHRQAAAIEAAELAVTAARAELRDARGRFRGADQAHRAAQRAAGEAWQDLQDARDRVVELGPPVLPPGDPHRAWTELLAWRDEATAGQRDALEILSSRVDSAVRTVQERREELADQLARGGVAVPHGAAPTTISAEVATAAERASAALAQVRDRRRRATDLTGRVERCAEQAQVAHELAHILRANNFEKWLCTEALGGLIDAATATLRELSGGQFELDLDERGDLAIIDYGEAGLRRSPRTLSGGETFQAALALALALSQHVAGFAAAATRSLDSLFLDEGFGSLDPASLDTVASTLERLASGGERMVGIVTHVPALAAQVPTRFEVSRDGTGSTVRKVST